MKRWIGLATGIACISSSIRADNAPLETTPSMDNQSLISAPQTNLDHPKQVGKASTDGTNTAAPTGIGKYVLPAIAVAVGVTALILVSRHDGHK